MFTMLPVLMALLPQGDVRSAGRVVDMNGRPVANAKVLFLARPIARSLDAGLEDRRAITTDERGRYRIELDREHRYTAWASWSDGATGCIDGVSGGEYLELRGELGAQVTKLRLSGLADWPGSDTFSVRAVVGGENFDFVPGMREGDEWQFPPMPPMRSRAFEVLDARGEIRWCSTFADDRAVSEIEVPELKQWEVTAVDAQGARLAGVTLRWHIRNYWYSASECLPYGQRFRSVWPVACVTDADGEGTITVPFRNQQQDLWMLAVKDGHTMSLDGIKGGKRFANGERLAEQPEEMSEPFRIVLQQSEPVTIDLREPSGRSNVAGWLSCCLRVSITHKNGRYGTIMLFDVPIEDGKAVLRSPLPPGTKAEVVETRLSEEFHADLFKAHGSAPWHWRSLHPANLLDGKPGADPFALHGPVPVQVTSVDGRPAARAAILFQGGGRSLQGLRTDRVGKAWLPGPGLGVEMIVAANEQGFAVAEAAAQDSTWSLQLQPFQYASVRVINQDGNAVAGVGVSASSCQVAAENEVITWGLGVAMRHRKMVVSDELGWVKLAVPPFVCEMRLSCSRRVEDGGTLIWDPGKPAKHSVIVGSPR